jgi:hypothetical protein
MAAIAQTIMIVDKSNKVVGTSKQLKNVFKEAKMAYMEKKAEIASEKAKKEDRELQKAIKAMSIAESESVRSDRPRRHRSSSRRDHDRERRPDLHIRPSHDRHYSGSSVHSGRSRRSSVSPRSPHSPSGHRSPVYRSPTYADYDEPPAYTSPVIPSSHRRPSAEQGLTRAQTDLDIARLPNRPRNPSRANSTSALDVDMDLAYGEYHPHLDPLSPMNTREVAVVQREELSSLVLKCKMLMDEANCAQHSVKAIVAHLQKNPDAMAAVALTLAEISNIVSKMAPAALAAFKVGAPSVFALLAAPEFLIAVGVSVGITVVMFGGYKIMKKIKAARQGDESPGVDEAIAVEELSHIDQWRRGIADSAFDPNEDARTVVSNGTSVEGEFITPIAARSLGHLPDTMRGDKAKKDRKVKEKDKEASKKSRKSSSSKSASSKGSSRLAPGERAVVKVKKPSPLRRMFNRDDRSSVAS